MKFQKGHKINNGRKWSDEARISHKLSVTEEVKKKISDSLKGKHTAEKHPMWNGGIKYNRGYIYIYNPDHPNATKQGYIRQHRLIIEKYAGIILEKQNVVHHINHIKNDNRIENLMCFKDHSTHRKFECEAKYKKCNVIFDGRNV